MILFRSEVNIRGQSTVYYTSTIKRKIVTKNNSQESRDQRPLSTSVSVPEVVSGYNDGGTTTASRCITIASLMTIA